MSLECVWQWGGKSGISSKYSMTQESEKCLLSGRKDRKGGNSSTPHFLQQCLPAEIKDFGHPGSMRFKFPSSICARFGDLLNLPLGLRISREPKVHSGYYLPAYSRGFPSLQLSQCNCRSNQLFHLNKGCISAAMRLHRHQASKSCRTATGCTANALVCSLNLVPALRYNPALPLPIWAIKLKSHLSSLMPRKSSL